MSVLLTTQAPQYFLQKFENKPQAPVTRMELTSIYKKTNPKTIGTVVAQVYEMEDSLLAEVMARGNEMTIAASQVTWREKETTHSAASITRGVTHDEGTFTINNNAIPSDIYDFDSDRPTEAKWVQVSEGLEFAAFDSEGNTVNGKITAIAPDLKSFTASPIAVANWDDLGEDVEIYFTGHNLSDCELAPCIGYEGYTPSRQNTFFKDSVCETFCKETEIANGRDGVEAETIFNSPDGEYNVSLRLEDKQKLLIERMENEFMFGRPLTTAQAGTGKIGSWGVMPTLELRATKNEGMIETVQDAINLAAQLRDKKIKRATLRCTNDQYTKLMALFPLGASLSFNPFTDYTNELYSFGFGGFKIGDVEIIFQRLSVLDRYGSNVGKRYHYLVIPDKKLTREINGKTYECNYLNVAWFGSRTEVWKFLRSEDPETAAGKKTIHFVAKFAPIIFRPQDFIIGMTA